MSFGEPDRGADSWTLRLRPMRGLKRERPLWVLAAAHAFVQNVRRGHYELASDEAPNKRLLVAFEESALAL
jgi:IS6 family transposase